MTTDHSKAAAKQEGRYAAKRGLLPIANPYFDDAELAASWRDGYQETWSKVLAENARIENLD